MAVIGTDLIDLGVAHSRVRLLDANVDSSWSHRMAAATLAVGAAVSLLGAARSPQRRSRWMVTAAILIVLFVAEASPVHAQVDRLSYGKLIYAPLLLALVACVWPLAHRSTQGRIMNAGLAALFASYTVHIFGLAITKALGWGAGGWAYQAYPGLKEGLELAGWLLLVLALYRLASAAAGGRFWDGGQTPPASLGLNTLKIRVLRRGTGSVRAPRVPVGDRRGSAQPLRERWLASADRGEDEGARGRSLAGRSERP